MKVTILTSELQAEFIKNYQAIGIESVVSTESDEGGFYHTTIEFIKFCDVDVIAQIMFSAGLCYGLDLKYSSYDNDISR